ncbi:MAG: DUF4202 family protein [Candidatus Scalindua sediminis]|nr:DUF4202 family protein [Candidatus Scalindua sediminis]
MEWPVLLETETNEALQIAALAHDIDRAVEKRKILRADFNDYDAFKAAHAKNSARILGEILNGCHVEQTIINEACRLVERHEAGGDLCSDLLKDSDSISFFEVNMLLYFQREGYEETLKRCIWGYHRLSPKMKAICQKMTYSHHSLVKILQEAICNTSEKDESGPNKACYT